MAFIHDSNADTPIPGMMAPFTWQASLELSVQLYTALGQCNMDKAGIRKIENARENNYSQKVIEWNDH